MNHIQRDLISEAARASRYRQSEFSAFRVSGPRTIALGDIDADNLPDAIAAALTNFLDHKEQLIIREIDYRAKDIPERLGGGIEERLHVFTIKRKSIPRLVHQDHVTRRVHDLYADKLCVIDARAITEKRHD